MEYIEAEVIDPHNELEILMTKARKKRIASKILFGGLIIIWLFLLLLYFILPNYRLESIEVKGLNYFEKNDILTLANCNQNDHIIAINEEHFAKDIITNSDNLIIDAKASIGIFSSKVEIIEDMPIFNYDDRIYFYSLGDKNDYLRKVSNFLPKESMYKINDKINHINSSDLINLHLLKKIDGESAKNLEVKKAITPFLGINFNILKYISDVQFTNYYEALSAYTLCDAIIEDNDFKAVIRSIRYDTILDVFNSETTIKSILKNSKESKNKLKKIDYKFLDSDEKIIDIYELRVAVNDHTVRIYTN